MIVIAHPSIQKIKGANLFDINLLKSFDEEISDFYSLNGDSFIVLKSKVLFNNKEYQIPSGRCFITYFNQINRPVAFNLVNNKIFCLDVVNNKSIPVDLECSNLFKVDDRIYCTQNNKLLQLIVEKVGQSLFCKNNVVGNVLDLSNATKCFDSVLVQNMLGRYYFSILPKHGECYQVPVKELDGFKIINAKFDKSVLIVSAIDLKGNKCRFTIKLNSNYVTYACSVKNNVQSSEINFCVNDAGICVMINEEEKVEIFTSNPTSNSVKILDDPLINGNMILTTDGSKIIFYNDKDLYSFSVKK